LGAIMDKPPEPLQYQSASLPDAVENRRAVVHLAIMLVIFVMAGMVLLVITAHSAFPTD
jgi:hypothetical protein